VTNLKISDQPYISAMLSKEGKSCVNAHIFIIVVVFIVVR